VIHEAEVFLMADRAAVEVFSTIADQQWSTVLPPIFDMPGADVPTPLRQAINHYAYDNAWVPAMLAGRTMDEVGRHRFDGDLLGADPADAVARISAEAAGSARGVTDPDATVHCSFGDVAASDYFWQLNIARTLSAHDVAVHIGSSFRLGEELSRAMYEGTEPTSDMWRSFGIYRDLLPVPESATWRERYLALTGRRAVTGRAAAYSD
jgi:hypothetical protein